MEKEFKIIILTFLELPIFKADKHNEHDYFFMPIFKEINNEIDNEIKIIKIVKLDITGANIMKLTYFLKFVSIEKPGNKIYMERLTYIALEMAKLGLSIELEKCMKSISVDEYINICKEICL